VLHVATERGTCLLAIIAGVPRAASGPAREGEALGDALLREGALDMEAHRAALLTRVDAEGPVGRWLVDAGLVSRSALECALRAQLRERVLQLFACRSLDYRFEPGDADVGVPPIEEPITSADLVLAALRAQVAQLSEEQLLRMIEPGQLSLNALGRSLTHGAALWPEEAAAVALLTSGASCERIQRATDSAPRALRLLCALTLLSAVTAEPERGGRFALLLRKREQIRRAAPAHALLDLPDGAAPGAGRRALRRLARSLHPDALGPDAPAALRDASHEVMEGLVEAERTLRAD
jgi:hypothetical protein